MFVDKVYSFLDANKLFRICRSGFYHDPVAGWYYCSKDGLYYKHENGEYVPLEHDESNVDPLVHIVTSEDAQADALGKIYL